MTAPNVAVILTSVWAVTFWVLIAKVADVLPAGMTIFAGMVAAFWLLAKTIVMPAEGAGLPRVTVAFVVEPPSIVGDSRAKESNVGG